MKLIAAIYWYQKKTELWYMIVDDESGAYIQKPQRFNVDHDKKLITEAVHNIFTLINENREEGHELSIRYKTITTVAFGIQKSWLKPNKESIEIDTQIKEALRKYKFVKRQNFDKKKEIKTNQREILQDILSPLIPIKSVREVDLWAIAFHKDSFENLAKKLWKIVKNATGEPVKRGDLKTKFEVEYQQLLKAHSPKK